MELFLIKAEYADPNNVLPEGFPGKRELTRFPFAAYNAWDNLREDKNGSVNEDPDLRNCLINHGIKEDLNIWANIFDSLREAVIPIGKDDWTDAKYDLYAKYLIDPKSRIKTTPISLDGKEYYTPLLKYEEFTLWRDLVKFVEDNFGRYPIPYDDEKVKLCDRLKNFKKRIEYNDEQEMEARQYAEFLAYCLPTRYFRIFVMSDYTLFPYLTDLLDMYEDGLRFDRNFLIRAWYVLWDGHARVRYGESKFEKELNVLFGNNKYKLINV